MTLRTPDGRYIVHVGRQGPRLWRASNPSLSDEELQALTAQLMNARRAVKAARGDADRLATARAQVSATKEALGERGDIWWTDGARDYNRVLVRNSPYAEWWNEQQSDQSPTKLTQPGRPRSSRPPN
jgi:peptidoglycan/xylan/chitin deacetylase (PgdA/CDA1 family)